MSSVMFISYNKVYNFFLSWQKKQRKYYLSGKIWDACLTSQGLKKLNNCGVIVSLCAQNKVLKLKNKTVSELLHNS